MNAKTNAETDTRPNPVVAVGGVRFGNALPLALIAGPCAMESRAHALEMASALKEIAGRVGIGLVFKTSFDKANRTSLGGPRGVGLRCVASRSSPRSASARGCLSLTDVHSVEQCAPVAEVVDVLQIPAFLCRQTDLLVAAARDRARRQRQEGAVPGSLGYAQRGRQGHRQRGKPQRAGDRARRLVRLQHAGVRHARAAHHGGDDRRAGHLRRDALRAAAGRAGDRVGRRARFVPVLARAAVAVGVAGVFIETHQDPDRAPSDGPNMMPLKEMEGLLKELVAFDKLAKAVGSDGDVESFRGSYRTPVNPALFLKSHFKHFWQTRRRSTQKGAVQ